MAGKGRVRKRRHSSQISPTTIAMVVIVIFGLLVGIGGCTIELIQQMSQPKVATATAQLSICQRDLSQFTNLDSTPRPVTLQGVVRKWISFKGGLIYLAENGPEDVIKNTPLVEGYVYSRIEVPIRFGQTYGTLILSNAFVCGTRLYFQYQEGSPFWID